MKKFILIISTLIIAFSCLYSQDIPSYVLPNSLFDAVGKEALNKTIILSNDMKNGKDPSFENVSPIFPNYMDYPKALVGIKEHAGRFLSSWDGAIIYPPFYLSFEIEERGSFFWGAVPFSDPTIKKTNHSLLGDYLPVINREFEYNGLIYEQTLMAHTENFSTEEPLIALVRMKVKNTGDATKKTTLSITFKGTGTRPSNQIWATSGYKIIDSPMKLYGKDNKVVNENGDVVFWTDTDGSFGEDRYSFPISLKPGEEKELYFSMPFEPLRESATTNLSKSYFDETYANVKTYWDDILNSGMRINVPEEIVDNAYKSWYINNFLLVQEDKSRLTYKTIDAPFFYEGIFGYAAAMYLNTITAAGHYEEAKKCARMFLRLQKDDGSISGVNRTNDVIPHQHGAILYTISQIYRMGRDQEWFARVAPDLIRGCEWIIRERSKTKMMGNQDISYGLLPPHRSNVDNAAGTQEYCGNAWCWAGMNEVGIALTELGGDFKNEGVRLLKEADQYRENIFASMDKATIKEEDLKFIPLYIHTKKPYSHCLESTEAFYYTWISCRMLESNIFDITDGRMSSYLNFFERDGLIFGLARKNGSYGLGYTAHFSAGYGISNLRMGKLDRSLLNFYGMLSYGMARNLYTAQEHDNFIEGKNDSWYWARQPHLHSTSELIRITNKMLVLEEKTELWLAHGTPRAWLENGKNIEVTNAQTCFGPCSFSIKSKVANKIIEATVHCQSSSNLPSAIKLKLRHPEGKSIKKVEINGSSFSDYENDIIILPGGSQKHDIIAYY